MSSESHLGAFIRVFSQLLSGEAWNNHYSIIIFGSTAKVLRLFVLFAQIALSAEVNLSLSVNSSFKMQPLIFVVIDGGPQSPQLERRQHGYE